ncbi:MAG: hypothetical protein AAFX06_28980 [Planctomycetota bacterium]
MDSVCTWRAQDIRSTGPQTLSHNRMHAPSPLQSLPATRQDRWTVLDQLILRWHPHCDEAAGFTTDDIRNAECAIGVSIPKALVEWQCTSGKRRSIWSCQDEFLSPDRLYVENDGLIFFVENQGVVKWAIPISAIGNEDPPVVVESVDNAGVWIPQSDTLSEFAFHMFAYTLAFTDSGDSWIYGHAKPPLVAALETRFPALTFPATWWTGTRLLGHADLVVAIDGSNYIHASALSDAAMMGFTSLTSNDNFEIHASSDG